MVLLESLIAVLLFSLGILALVGLQTAMLKNTTDSKYRADAAFIAQQRLGLMWTDPSNVATYLEPSPGTDISSLLPNGRRMVTQPSTGKFIVTITWQLPGESAHNFTTNAIITGG